MLLSFMGAPMTRDDAKAIFGLRRSNPEYTGTRLDTLARILRDHADVTDVRWTYLPRFSFERVVEVLRRQQSRAALPTLLWFGAECRAGRLRAFHIAVVTGLHDSRIDLLDPLGHPPEKRCRFNVSIARGRREKLDVEGSFYSVDRRKEVGVLCWRRR